MINWISSESQWKVGRKSTEKCTWLKYQNSYEYLTEADFYSNSRFYRESRVTGDLTETEKWSMSKGSRMPISSRMANLGNTRWKNANIRQLIIKLYHLRFLRPFGHKMQAKITKSVPNLPKFFRCHGIWRCLLKCQIHQTCQSQGHNE